MKPVILIVEDEEVVRKAVRLACDGAGYPTIEVGTATEALRVMQRSSPKLVILDLKLPDMSGFDVCREIRQGGAGPPIIMLTALTDEVEKVVGLEMGADDYITKPFSPRELVARIGAVLRRTAQWQGERDVVAFGDVVLSHTRREVTVRGRSVHLTRTEFAIVSLLATQPGRVFSRDELVQLVWSYDGEGDSRLLDVHIRRLRVKLEEDPSSPRHIATVRDVGYKLNLS